MSVYFTTQTHFFIFQKYLDIDTNLASDKVLELTDKLVNNLNGLLKKLKTIFLVEDFVESLKFAVGNNI